MFSLLPLPVSPIKPSSPAIAPVASDTSPVAESTTSAPQSAVSRLPPVTASESGAETEGAAYPPLSGGDIASRGLLARARLDTESAASDPDTKMRRETVSESIGSGRNAPDIRAEAAQALRQSQRTDPAPEPKLMLTL
jgi:hypothetical protein